MASAGQYVYIFFDPSACNGLSLFPIAWLQCDDRLRPQDLIPRLHATPPSSIQSEIGPVESSQLNIWYQ